MKAVVHPVITEYYEATNLSVQNCIAEMQALKNAGGPNLSADLGVKRQECSSIVINENFENLLNAIVAALQQYSAVTVTFIEVYYELLGSDVGSLECIADDLRYIVTYINRQQADIDSAAVLDSSTTTLDTLTIPPI